MEKSEEGLPDDIVFEILLRLPVKSLVQLRRVCKSWRKLLCSNELFARSHLNYRGIGGNDVNADILMFCYKTKEESNKKWQNHDLLAAYGQVMRSRNSTKLPVPIHLGKDFRVAGCCDGLVCYYMPNSSTMYLWNPALHQCRALYISKEYGLTSFIYFVGFGYDRQNQDYKIVRVTLGNRGRAYVFSLKHNSWKSIANSFHNHPSDTKGINVREFSFSFNGCLHWTVTHKWYENEHRGSILVFDISGEKLDLFEFPSSAFWLHRSFPCLGVIRGCLSFVTGAFSVWEVWSIKTYGANDSWMKVHLIGGGPGLCLPIGFSANGKILFLKGQKTVLSYDPERSGSWFAKLFELMEPCSESDHYFLTDYVESLISVNPASRWLKFKYFVYLLKPFLFQLVFCFIAFILLVFMLCNM